MKTEVIQEKCKILEKVVIELAKSYALNETTPRQKALLETTVGAALFYISSDKELYSGEISPAAVELLEKGSTIYNLTKEHKFPRKQAGKLLLSEKYIGFITGTTNLYDLFIGEFGRYNYVTKNENKTLIKYQKDGSDHRKAYEAAGINLIKMTYAEIHGLMPKKTRKVREKNSNTDVSVSREPITRKTKTLSKEPKVPSPLLTSQKLVKREFENAKDDEASDFTGLKVNGVTLIKNARPSKCYSSFMNYVIENHSGRIQDSEMAARHILNGNNDPAFGTDAMKYPERIVNHKEHFYNTHTGNPTKKNRMIRIAEELGFNIEFLNGQK